MTSFNLTPKEFAAARILVASCLSNMGGKRPADLGSDEYTWVGIDDLEKEGYTKAQARGYFAALLEKGFIHDAGDNKKVEMVVATKGWQWMETVWDSGDKGAAPKAAKELSKRQQLKKMRKRMAQLKKKVLNNTLSDADGEVCEFFDLMRAMASVKGGA